MTNHVFILPDKRELSYALYGPGDGVPVLYFHGTPSSRLEPSLLAAYDIDAEALLHKYWIQLIAIDRPGMGYSTFHATRTFMSFADDVYLLLEELNIRHTKIMCWSGGGPYALAMAFKYSDKIKAIYIIAGFTVRCDKDVFSKMHSNKLYFGTARNFPGLMKVVMNFFLRKKNLKPIPKFISKLPEVDSKLMAELTNFRHLAKVTAQEGVRNGSRGAVHDAALYFTDFGYDLKQIEQPVHYWWGTEDNAVIRLHAEAVEKYVPSAVIHYKPNEGHLSIYVNYFEEVLKAIADIN